MSEFMRAVRAFVSSWEFDFAFFWTFLLLLVGTFLLLLVVACLVAPWVHRVRGYSKGRRN